MRERFVGNAAFGATLGEICRERCRLSESRFAPAESLNARPNARQRSRFQPARSSVKPAATRREPALAMGPAPPRFVCSGGGGIVVAGTERSALPAVGNSSRTPRARRLVCRLCFRAQARGLGAPADSQGLSESGGSDSLRRATGSAGQLIMRSQRNFKELID